MDAIKVGLIGFGTIGTGVVRVLQKNSALLQKRLGKPLQLAKIADLDITTDRGVSVNANQLSTDVEDVSVIRKSMSLSN